MAVDQTEETLAALSSKGVTIVDPRQVYIGPSVQPDRVCEGAILHPGTRLLGAGTFVGPKAEVGAEGPATLVDTVLGASARVDAGYLEGAVLFDEARAGWGAHFRAGTILEEGASTAHAVGLKQTILLSFVTVGSLVNLCDCLMAGGSSRVDHSEVGSGFIHFNFTPWGESGDKATPSLMGDVVRGVFLRERRIFLGGVAGLVGPGRVGYGAVTGAGQVIRSEVHENVLSVKPMGTVEVVRPAAHLDRAEPRNTRNLQYIAQLVALRCWYRQVRLPRIPQGPQGTHRRAMVEAAIGNLDRCIAERVKRLRAFLQERELEMPPLDLDVERSCPLPVEPSEIDHVTWVQSLRAEAVDAGQAWLQEIVDLVLVDSMRDEER